MNITIDVIIILTRCSIFHLLLFIPIALMKTKVALGAYLSSWLTFLSYCFKTINHSVIPHTNFPQGNELKHQSGSNNDFIKIYISPLITNLQVCNICIELKQYHFIRIEPALLMLILRYKWLMPAFVVHLICFKQWDFSYI